MTPKPSQPRPSESDERGSLAAKLLRAGNRVYCRTFHQIDVQRPLQLPPTGPAILVCNHISGLDPLLLQSVASRPIVWMMAKEYYEIAALRWVYEAVQAIPVERNGRDSSATRAALRAIADGRVLGIFPEGRIETDGQLLPFQTGVAMMAIRTRTPIFPAHLEGSNRGQSMVQAFITGNRIKIRFGDRIDLHAGCNDDKPDLDISTQRIFDSVAKLKCETV